MMQKWVRTSWGSHHLWQGSGFYACSSHSPRSAGVFSMQLCQAVHVTYSQINSLNSEGQALGLCQVLGWISTCFRSGIKIILTILWVTVVRRVLPRDKSSGIPEATGKTIEPLLVPFIQTPKYRVLVQQLQRYTMMEIQKVLVLQCL